MSEQASDASHEAHFGWWEEGDMSSTHHVVHGTASSIEALKAREAKLREALEEISEGAGPFSRDPLEHASNCIEAMKACARAALAAAQPKKEDRLCALCNAGFDEDGICTDCGRTRAGVPKEEPFQPGERLSAAEIMRRSMAAQPKEPEE